MGMVKRLLEDYCVASHPGDYESQDKLMADICEGRISVTFEQMTTLVNKTKNMVERQVETCYGYDDVACKSYRFISDYQRSLWLKQNPDHRHTMDPSHILIRRIKEWHLLENDIEEGV